MSKKKEPREVPANRRAAEMTYEVRSVSSAPAVTEPDEGPPAAPDETNSTET